MGRHPAHIEAKLSVRVPRGQQAYWDIIRDLASQGEPFTVRDILLGTNAPKDTVGEYVARLVRGGYLERVGAGPDRRMRFRLLRDRPDAPRVRKDGSEATETGRGNDQLWRAMRMLKTFTARELAVYASTDTVVVKLATARAYCDDLAKVGYLAVIEEARTGHISHARPRTYRLRPDMVTGPRAPMIQRTKFVWDPNLKKIMGACGSAGGDA